MVETPMADQIFDEISDEERAFWESTVPLGRFAKAEEVASVILHLSAPESSYTNGLLYNLDGGATAGYFNPPRSQRGIAGGRCSAHRPRRGPTSGRLSV